SQFLVTFGGTLFGTHQSLLVPAGSGGQSPSVIMVTDGSYGTVVASGATLQLQGGILVQNEPLTLNGTGFNSAGALENVSGDSSWGNSPPTVTNPTIPIILGSSVVLGADAGNLILHQPITDGGKGFGVTQVGPGTIQYRGVVPNTYTGLTQVNEGTLILNKSPV